MSSHRLLQALGMAVVVAAAPAVVFAQAARPTPHLANNQPDLNGTWLRGAGDANGIGNGRGADANGDVYVQPKARDADLGNFEKDSAVLERSDPNKPIYKPEYWDKVQDLDWNGLKLDPSFSCKPAGLPRMGPPQKIVQTEHEVVLLYESGNTFRTIPTDGREHDPVRANDQTWMGDSVGRWEGDTLVVDSVGFNDLSWLGWTGYLHSNDLHVIERFRREGDRLHYDVTVEDPTVLQEPWRLDPQTLHINPNPKAQLWQDLPCEERDSDHIVEKNMRG
jgi:hypothetical protein